MSNVGAVLVFAQQPVVLCVLNLTIQVCKRACIVRQETDKTGRTRRADGAKERGGELLFLAGKSDGRMRNMVPLRIWTRIDATSSF